MVDLFSGASAQITPFSFNTHAVRVVMRDGEPWFVASDVASALGYRNAPDAARNLGDHQKASTQIVRSSSGGNPNVTIINESGLYRLVLRSRKPEAEKFSDWVTGVVLPSIRKTGGYCMPSEHLSRISVDRQHLDDIYQDLSRLCKKASVAMELVQDIQNDITNMRSRVNGLGMDESDLPPQWWQKKRVIS